MEDEKNLNERRRQLLKGAALGAGGVTISSWTKPVVEKVVLPAHAQTTAPQDSFPRGRITQSGSVAAPVTFPSP